MHRTSKYLKKIRKENKMSKEEIYKKIIICLEKEKTGGIKKESITSSTNLFLDLELDSIEIVNFVVALEEVFEVRFNEPFELINKFESINKLVEYCDLQLNGGRN